MTHKDLTLIGLTGPAGAGKDTVARFMCQRFGFVSASFAAAPRAMLEALLSHVGADHAYLFEPTLKEQKIPGIGASYRQLMQTLGTEWGREQIDPEIWVRALQCSLGLLKDAFAPVHDRIVITDVRMPNEAEMVEGAGGLLVAITRPQAAAVRPHSSESHIGTLYGCARHYLVNDSSLPGLQGQIETLCSYTLGLDSRPPLGDGREGLDLFAWGP